MSQEKLLYESGIVESSPNAPETISPGTGSTDIAQQAPKARLARNVLTQSLPFQLGFVQPLTSPVSFVFGFQDRGNTDITHSDFPLTNKQPPSAERYGLPPGTPPTAAEITHPSTSRNPSDPQTIADTDGLGGENPAAPSVPSPANPEDPIIIRRLVEAQVREVIFDMTNETIQDIDSLFKDEFPELLQKFIDRGGELYGFDTNSDVYSASLENFFLPQMINKATAKINTDFINWADDVSSKLGTVTIPTLQDMSNIFTAIGEMREALSKNTNKSGSVFILCTPRIANYIAGTLGMTNSNGGDFLERGKPNQNPHLNGFVGQFGDVKVYQVRGSRTVTDESIIMGFDGEMGANTASVYYCPYKEYIIQGGDDYMTGQSSVFYRVRDTWSTNPLDVFAGDFGNPEGVPTVTDSSKYLVKAVFDIQEKAIN
jgi:hypothetical protein